MMMTLPEINETQLIKAMQEGVLNLRSQILDPRAAAVTGSEDLFRLHSKEVRAEARDLRAKTLKRFWEGPRWYRSPETCAMVHLIRASVPLMDQEY